VLPHHSLALNRHPWIVIDNAELGKDAEARPSQETGRFKLPLVFQPTNHGATHTMVAGQKR